MREATSEMPTIRLVIARETVVRDRECVSLEISSTGVAGLQVLGEPALRQKRAEPFGQRVRVSKSAKGGLRSLLAAAHDGPLLYVASVEDSVQNQYGRGGACDPPPAP